MYAVLFIIPMPYIYYLKNEEEKSRAREMFQTFSLILFYIEDCSN